MSSFVHLIDQRRLIGPGGSTVSGDIYFYYTSTSVFAPVYLDADLTIPAANPMSVGAGEPVPQLFLDSEITYRRVIIYSDGTRDETDPLGNLFSEGELGLPVGAIIDYSGVTAPTGFLFCAGQAVSRTIYSDLFTAIGTTYGAGNGSTTFNLPDARGRVLAGKDNMDGSTAGRLTSPINGTILGAAGGEEAHLLTSAEIPSHTHSVTDPGHTHTYTASSGGAGALGYTPSSIGANQATQSSVTGITIQSTGGGGSHNNVQPTIVINKIIKTTATTFLSLLGISPEFNNKANASAIGIGSNDTNMGDFTGGIVSDDVSAKVGIQEIIDEINTRIPLTFSHAASYLTGSPMKKLQQFVDPRDAPFNAAADGITDDYSALSAALATGKLVYLSPELSYAFGTQLVVPDFGGFVGGGKLIMLTGSGKFDNATYSGGYATNKTGILINGKSHPRLECIVEMQTNAGIRTCNAVTVISCTSPYLKVEASGFKEAHYGIIEANTNSDATFRVNVHDCGANSTSLPSMQITGLSIDSNRVGGVNSVGPLIFGRFNNIRLGAAAGALYGEQTDGLNIQTTGYSGARITVFANNVGEGFDNFGDYVIGDVIAENVVNYGVKLIHGASLCNIRTTVNGCGIYGVVIGSDNTTKSCNRNIVTGTISGVGAVSNPLSPAIRAAFGTDGSSATFQPTNNTINLNVVSTSATATHVVYVDAGSGNTINVEGTLSYSVAFGTITGTAGANNQIRRPQGTHIRAYMGTATTATNNTAVAYDTEVLDPTNEFNPVTGLATMNCAGRYRIKAQIRFGAIASGVTAGLAIDYGPALGSRTARFVPIQSGAGSVEHWAQVQAVLDLNAGDSIRITCLSSSGAALGVTNVADYTFLEIDQI